MLRLMRQNTHPVLDVLQAQYALYESASGFSLFVIKEQDAIGTTADAVQQSVR